MRKGTAALAHFALVFRMAQKIRMKPHSTNILDYPSNMSMYERESLAAEARLKAEKKPTKRPKPEKLFAPEKWVPMPKNGDKRKCPY